MALAGFAAPAAALLLLGDRSESASFANIAGPALAIGLMGAGMIGAAAAGRFWTGALLAAASGAALLILAGLLGIGTMPRPLFSALCILVASVSFAARGALFARSSGAKGWWIALFVVAGEAAIVITAWARPGELPDWLLALLPAQWASMAITSSLTGQSFSAAGATLIALAGTALATMCVFWLWPRRWTYLIMFTTWLALSALVYKSVQFS
jgi:hypothetical protein